jgi:hypothetical protein
VDSYRETKDTERVVAELEKGFQAQAYRFSEHAWRFVTTPDGISLVWRDGGRRTPVETVAGRVFRIEAKNTKVFTGPTVELTPELLGGMRKHCMELERRNGSCQELSCSDCPGSMAHNDGHDCTETGWASKCDIDEQDPVAKANSTRFLAEYPAQPKKRLERVEFFRDDYGVLRYHIAHFTKHHSEAVSEKGYDGYVWADGTKSNYPVRYGDDSNEFPVAFEQWVEEE